MVKPKSGGLARLPKEQRCSFLIGPVSSWFMPKTTDLWTHPNEAAKSYFGYGSIGCFCYGKIYHQPVQHSDNQPNNQISANLNRLIHIKEDNSRVACIRFLKKSPYPLVIVLTESGSLLLHDCVSSENLVHFKKSEVLTKLVGLTTSDDNNAEHGTKRAKFNVTQQINSCAWPDSKNAFLGVSLLKEKTCLLIWLKLKNIIELRSNPSQIDKNGIVEQCQKLELNLPQYSSPICLIESAMLDEQTCLVAVAMDDGLITVVNINFEKGQSNRVIKLVRHNDQICSMSIFAGNIKKFPLGLLASVSRNGLVLIWDIENEFYFADYQAVSDTGRSASHINWFALCFVPSAKHVYLAVSNSESGITMLELPENARSKIRLKDSRDKSKKQVLREQALRHNALIFNIEFDPITKTIITSSLDGNHIFWNVQQQELTNDSHHSIDAKPQFLYPAMLNNSRTHMLRHSPIREDLLGCALGKAGLRFYKIPENIVDCRFDMTSSYALIARRITKANLSPTSISWHPSHEYRLAIGTLEGKVFRADLTPRKATLLEAEHKPVITSKLSQKPIGASPKKESSVVNDIFEVEYQPLERNALEKSETTDKDDQSNRQLKTDGVYSLSWGPNPACPQDISKQAIYAVGSVSHRLFIYYNNKENSDKLNNYLDEFMDQSLPEAIGEASEVAWKSSMDLMALGTTNGKVIIVTYLDESHAGRSKNKLFKRLAVIQGPLGNTYVQCLSWHPTTDKDDHHYYYIATSANESPAFVFNLRETILVADVKSRLKIEQRGDEEEDQYSHDNAVNMLSAYLHKLDAHKKAITDIAWNPHEQSQLATCSFDRFSYVWSIDNSFMDAQIISKFSARDRLFTVEWSLVDTDLIFTSGHDSTIWAWRPTENRVKCE